MIAACRILVILLVITYFVSGASDFSNIPEYDLEAPELIKKHGYAAETHTVTTEDGYILTLHRIPCGRYSNSSCANRPVILIHHTLLCTSACWLIMGPDKALPYLLADEGYDIWLANARGNKYSRKHKSLKTKQSKFWNFSWHEMGVYDLPASIDYILEHTNQSDVFYVGHSMGSTIFYVLLSMRPEYSYKIRLSVSIAPIVFTDHIKHSTFRLAALSETGGSADRKYSQEFLSSSKLRNRFLQRFCRDGSAIQELCSLSIFFYGGLNFSQLNRTMLPLIFSHFPAGSSLKTWVHYGQEMISGKFRQYDHGENLNLELYGTSEPPDYNLSEVTVPVSLHYSQNDIIATSDDVENLYNTLPKVINNNVVSLALFGHLDFLWGIDVKTTVYDEIIDVIKKFISSSK